MDIKNLRIESMMSSDIGREPTKTKNEYELQLQLSIRLKFKYYRHRVMSRKFTKPIYLEFLQKTTFLETDDIMKYHKFSQLADK